MKSIEAFLSERYTSSSQPADFTSLQNNKQPVLPDEVHEGSNRGWQIYPVPELAKLAGNPNLLIGEATCQISRLEELAIDYYPLCGFRVASGPSSLCILQLDGPQGKNAFASLAQDQEECLTLQAGRGDVSLAFFRWPKGLVLRASARKLAPGVRILSGEDSCVLLPFRNPWADVEAIPYWLRELAFETPDTPRGKAGPVLASFHRPAPCRSSSQFQKSAPAPCKGHPVCGRVGGFRISRRS